MAKNAISLDAGMTVESKYHGKGRVSHLYGGKAVIIFEPLKRGKKKVTGGGEFHYELDGRYFSSGEFEDKAPVLKVTSNPKEEENEREGT